jgi:5'-methylthioadenosine phosphorylase
VCIEGPQFSTRAESHLFRTWPNVSVIGMTNMPEARLAMEAELSYATVAMATDYDCWNEAHDAVSVDQVIETLKNNVVKAKQVITAVAKDPPSGPCASRDALRFAVMTSRESIPEKTYQRVALFLDKYR